MADYVTAAIFKDAIKYEGTDRDTEYGRVITAASRLFDRLTRREDSAFVAQTLTKTFDVAEGANTVPWIPSLQSVTTLKTDHNADGVYETAWTTSDYRLYPLDGPPYVKVEVRDGAGQYTFPTGQATVEIAGSWGVFATVPLDVQRAVILLAHRLVNRSKTPEGIMGSLDQGFIQLRDLDPDVKAIAAYYTDPRALFS